MNGLEFSPDGQHFLLVLSDGRTKVWRWDGAQATPRTFAERIGGRGGQFVLEGRGLLVSHAESAELWEIESELKLEEFPVPALRFGRLTPDKTGAAFISADPERGDSLVFFRFEQGSRETQRIQGKGVIRDFRFSPDGGRIILVGDRSGQILDRASGQAIGNEFKVHGTPVGFDFSRDGLRFLIVTADRFGRVHDAHTGNLLVREFPNTWLEYGTCFTPDGRRICTGVREPLMQFWEAGPAIPADWLDASEVLRELRRLNTRESLRLAVWLAPEDQEVWRALIVATRAAPGAWSAAEASFLDRQLDHLEKRRE